MLHQYLSQRSDPIFYCKHTGEDKNHLQKYYRSRLPFAINRHVGHLVTIFRGEVRDFFPEK